MDENKAKIRLKISAIEIEYEGESSFLKDDLLNLVRNVVGLYTENKSAIPVDATLPEGRSANPTGSSGELEHTTNTIAAHLGAKSGPELAIAAAAHLTFAKKKGSFTRREIDTEMKSATPFYTKNMSSNLTTSLNTLIKGKRLNQVAKDAYALSATEKAALENKLAQPL